MMKESRTFLNIYVHLNLKIAHVSSCKHIVGDNKSK